MGLSSSRLLYLALTLFCAIVAFMPGSDPARWLDLSLAPSRVLGELAAPIGMFARREVRAAESALSSALEAEHEASRKLAENERMEALPFEAGLIGSRSFAHALVLHRLRDTDLIECELEQECGTQMQVDLPVVYSNSYVGRVVRVDLAHQRITVALATQAQFRIGASLVGADSAIEPVSMVVGGVEPTEDRSIVLAVHNPERADLNAGEVRVDEHLNAQAQFRELSAGFLLGHLSLATPNRPVVIPDIDFKDGLFRVVVVLPPLDGPPAPARKLDVFAGLHWRQARAYSACEPAAWREGLKVDCSYASGARVDSAVAAGARLVGRIARAGALESDVALMGDRGLSVQALASIDGVDAPLVLGKLVALGRERRNGPARLLWTPKKPLQPKADGSTRLAAQLFTGAGELGVPPGLWIGRTQLPCGPGPHVLEVEQELDLRLMRKLWIWRGIEVEELESAGRQ